MQKDRDKFVVYILET